MKRAWIIGGVFLAALIFVALLAVLAGAGTYNRIVREDQGVAEAWAQVQNVYQRRADLVPNLVATVSGAANFEKSTIVAVTEARASVGKVQIGTGQLPTAEQMQTFQKAQDGLGAALSRLLVVSENYPQLRATEAFRDLQTQLEGTENRISVERGKFNSAAQAYNSHIKSLFLPVIVARLGGFQPKAYFQANPGAESVPKVQF
jgi:LemA protein